MLSSYLLRRRESVKNEIGRPTGYRPSASSVPKGSIRGSLLVCLFIRDISDVLRHSSCRTYANDTLIYQYFKTSNINAAIARVQMDIQAIEDWAFANRLQLIERNTKIIHFGSVPYVASINSALSSN